MRPYLVLHMEAEGLLSLAGVDGCLFSSFSGPLSLLYLKWFHSLLVSATTFSG